MRKNQVGWVIVIILILTVYSVAIVSDRHDRRAAAKSAGAVVP